jgi:hypothetical protein
VVATLDTQQLYADHTINVLYATGTTSLCRILAILNSALANYWFLKRNLDINIKGIYLEEVPLPRSLPADLDALVSRMLYLAQQLGVSKTSPDRTRLEREIKANDREIDRLVYELYELTAEEIAIVEKATQRE